MAERLEDFDSWQRGGTTKYPWDRWFNGDVWLLTKGEDFTVAASSIRASAQQAGRGRSIKIRSRILNDGSVVLQALLDE